MTEGTPQQRPSWLRVAVAVILIVHALLDALLHAFPGLRQQ